MKKLVLSILFALGATAALAQGPGPGPGPGPTPDPWVVNGSAISYNGCVVVPASVNGGCKGNGTLNARVLYQAGFAVLSTDLANGRILVGNGSGVATAVVPSGDLTMTNAGAFSIAANAVTNAKLAQAAAVTLKGNPTNATADVQDFTISGLTDIGSPNTTLDFLLIWDHTAGTLKKVTPSAVTGGAAITALTGDVTATGPGSAAATIAANVVTYAKFQQVAAVSLVGNATGSLANAAGITLGATLAFSGSALQTAAHTGDVTTSANSFVTTLATAQPAVHTWALAQTFTVAPVYTDQSGTRTALGLGTMATQAASSVAITGGTIAGLTGLAIRDTSAAFDVTIAATSSGVLSAGRTLTINVGNVAHTLALGTTANTITFPNLASYTVITNGDTGTVTNAMLANSSLTVNGTSIALGASGTVTAAAGTLTGTTLNATVVTASLTTVGTIGTGVWQGTAVAGGFGGTNQTTYTKGDLLVTPGSTTINKLAVGTDGFLLTADAASTNGVKWAAAGVAAAGTLTGATLAANVLASSLTSVGTLSSLNLGGALTYGGVTFANSVTGSGSLPGSISPTFTGTLNAAVFVNSGNASLGNSSMFVSPIGYTQFFQSANGGPLIGFSTNPGVTLADTGWVRPAAAMIQQGDIDKDTNALIVAQTYRTQGLIAGGTSNQAGKNFTLIVSPGKGTGAGGSFIVQTAPAGSTGTSVNTPVTALTIDSAALATFAGQIAVTAMTQTSAAQSGTMCYNVSGAITYDATLGCLASTMRVKKDWHEIGPEAALAAVLEMRPGSFNYIEGMGLPDGEQIGLAAEQMEKVDARLVGYNNAGQLMGVRYQQASALYPAAIRALKADNDNLRAANDNLLLRVQRLERNR